MDDFQENFKRDNAAKPKHAWEPTSSEQPSKTTWGGQQAWNTFVENCTLHGLYYVVHGRTTARKTIWSIFVLVGLSWFVFQSATLLTKFLSFPVSTKATLEYENMPAFPAVTICNFNTFRRSVAIQKGYFEVLLHFGAEFLKAKTDSNFASHLFKYNLTGLNMTAVHFEAGHQMKDMLLHCSWSGGQACTAEHFSHTLTDMGLCHTFNSGKCGQATLFTPQFFT